MTEQQIADVRAFALRWLDKVHRQSYTKLRGASKQRTERMLEVAQYTIEEICDSSCMSDAIDWDKGKRQAFGYSRSIHRIVEDMIENDPNNITQKCATIICCCIRIAVDLFVEPSGGVVGYTLGDLRKAFDGDVPQRIMDEFCTDVDADADDNTPIWL